MTPSQQCLWQECQRRKMGANVRNRIIHLNKDTKEGINIRGWHPAHSYRNVHMIYDVMSKGAFIKKHGRKAWDAMPNGMKWKWGRHKYVGRVPYLDNLWKLYSGEIPPHREAINLWYPTKRYANDKDCVVAYISGQEFQKRLGTV